jgi:hypothetical protein
MKQNIIKEICRPLIQLRKSAFLLPFASLMISIPLFPQSFQYSRRLGCDKAEDKGSAIIADQSGNQYSTGFFRSWNGIGAQPADMDPGPANFPMMTLQGGYNTYISKLNSNGNFVWAKQFAKAYNIGIGIAQDASGNLYVSGNFSGQVDFDPGPGTVNISTAGNDLDVFLVKLSPEGNFIWARTFGGLLNEENTALTIDNAGNLLLAGIFRNEVDFDPGLGTSILFCADGGDAFICKLTQDGNFIWAKNMGGRGDYGSLTTDAAGNIFLLSNFEGESDFNPDPVGTYTITSTANSIDFFITKLDGLGQFVWTSAFGSSGIDAGTSLKCSESGSLYVSANFQGDSLFDLQSGQTLGLNHSSQQTLDIALLKLNPPGTVKWVHVFGDTLDDESTSLMLTQNEEVFLSGTFRDSVDFNPGIGEEYLKSVGNPDGFILRLDSAGVYERILALSGLYSTVPLSMFRDSQENLHITGWYSSGTSGTVDFDPGPGTVNMNGQSSATGTNDIFILKLRRCEADSSILTITSCNSFLWEGSSYSQSGSYKRRLSTPNGCDSTVILNLTINQPSQSTKNYRLCQNQSLQVGTRIYTQAGIYLDTLIAANGCDSIITSTLAYDIPDDTIQLSAEFGALAAPDQDSYQWLDCNAGFAPITGETDSSFAPTLAGSYAVRVTKGNCADTSNCLFLVNSEPKVVAKSGLNIFPNPAQGYTTIDCSSCKEGQIIEIYSADGTEVKSLTINPARQVIVEGLPAGIYLLHVQGRPFTCEKLVLW